MNYIDEWPPNSADLNPARLLVYHLCSTVLQTFHNFELSS